MSQIWTKLLEIVTISLQVYIQTGKSNRGLGSIDKVSFDYRADIPGIYNYITNSLMKALESCEECISPCMREALMR